MTYRELRTPLFRFVTAVVFVTAIEFLRTHAVHGWAHGPGTCQEQQIEYGCNYYWNDTVYCNDVNDCAVNQGSETLDLCICHGPYVCGWWPAGCE